MSTKLSAHDVAITPAKTVRTKFAVNLAEHVEAFVSFAMKQMDERLTAYFDERIAAGEDPYPPPNRTARVDIITVEDFRSGNEPEMQGVFEAMRSDAQHGPALVKRLQSALNDAGFVAEVSIAAGRVSVAVSDPQFNAWVRNGHDVDAIARTAAAEQLRAELLAPLISEFEAPIREAARMLLRERAHRRGALTSTSITVGSEQIRALSPPHHYPVDKLKDALMLIGQRIATSVDPPVRFQLNEVKENFALMFSCDAQSSMQPLLSKLGG
jgi:hypothetical protein